MTKIIISLFVAIIALHGAAALLTYVTVSSGRYIEGNPTAAQLQFNYGMTAGLTITLLEGTLLSAVPLGIYLGTLGFARSAYVPLPDRAFTMRVVKLLFFPLALSVLAYLALIASADVTHDLAILLSNGQVNLWSF